MTTAAGHGNLTTRDGTDVSAGMARLTRLLPLTGVIFAVLAVAGNLTIDAFPDSDTPVGKVTAYYASHHTQVGRGGALLGYSVIFFALFGVALWWRVRRSAASPVIAATVLLGTALVAVNMLTSANTYDTLGQIAGQPTTSPQALQAWHITGSIGGIGADSIILLLAIAAAGILARAVPRWLAWSALLLAVMHFTPLGFTAYLLFYVWAFAAGIALTVRPNPAAAEATTASGRAFDPAAYAK
jgi:hypothetical protein